MDINEAQGVTYRAVYGHSLSYENVLKSLDTSVAILEEAKKDFLSYIQNKEISLDSRWKLYKKYSYLLPVKTYGCDFFNYDFIVDHYSRYELINYVSVIELLEEGYNFNYLSEDLTKEEILKLKEQALSSGCQGFYFDW